MLSSWGFVRLQKQIAEINYRFYINDIMSSDIEIFKLVQDVVVKKKKRCVRFGKQDPDFLPKKVTIPKRPSFCIFFTAFRS